MNVNEFLQNNGKTTVPNPEYNPKSKKNKQPPTIDVVTLDSDKNALHDVIKQSYADANIVDAKIAEKYEKYGLNWNAREAANGSLDHQLSEQQGWFSKLGNALLQGVWNETAVGIVKGFGDLFDIIVGNVFKGDNDYQNDVTKALEEYQEKFRQEHEIYQDPYRNSIANGKLTDWGFWFNQIPSAFTTISLLIPSTAVAKGVSLLGRAGRAGVKGIGLTRKANKAAKAAKEAETAAQAAEATRLSKFSNWANRPSTKLSVKNMKEAGIGGLASRTIENYQEARQVYNDMYQESSAAINQMSDDEYNDLLERNTELLKDKNIDTSDRDAVARAISKEAADTTFKMDYGNLLFDVFQMYTLRSPLKLQKNAPKNSKIKKAQRERKRYAGLSEDERINAIANRTKGQKVKDWLSDHLYYNEKLFSEWSEGIEEAVNYIAQEEGMHYGRYMLNTYNPDDAYARDRMEKYLKSTGLYESMIGGVMGGVLFQNVGGNAKKAINATVNTIKQNANYNEESKEGKKTTWKEQWELNDTKDRVANIQSAYEQLRILKERQAEIFDKNNPTDPFNVDENDNTKHRSLTNDAEQEAAWERAVDDYITSMTLNAIDRGNYNLLVDYLSDTKVQDALESIGINTKDTNIESLIARMNEVEQRYTDNLVAIDHLLGEERGDIPYEYIQLLARNYTLDSVNQDNLLNIVKKYKAQAAANERRYGIKESEIAGYDFKSAVDTIVCSQRLTKLRKRLQEIENDKEYAGSIDGIIEKRNLEEEIKSVNAHLENALYATKVGEVNANTEQMLSNVAKTIFANFRSYGKDDERYGEFLTAITNRDINKINELSGTHFKLKDNEILSLFGEDGTSGFFGTFQQNLKNDFGLENGETLSKMEKLADNLVDDYVKIASYNLEALRYGSQIQLNRQAIKNKIDEIHNFTNAARKAAISDARNTLIAQAKKYGRVDMLNYVFKNKNIEDMSQEDAGSIDEALRILNLTSDVNSNLRDMIQISILQGELEASEDENLNTGSENSITQPQNSQPDNNTTQQQKQQKSQENQQQSQSEPQTTQQTATQNQQQNNNDNNTQKLNEDYKLSVKFDVSNGITFTKVPIDSSDEGFRFNDILDENSNTIGVELRLDLDNNVSDDVKKALYPKIIDYITKVDKNNQEEKTEHFKPEDIIGKYVQVLENPTIKLNDDGSFPTALNDENCEKGGLIVRETAPETAPISSTGEVIDPLGKVYGGPNNDGNDEASDADKLLSQRQEKLIEKIQQGVAIQKEMFGKIKEARKNGEDLRQALTTIIEEVRANHQDIDTNDLEDYINKYKKIIENKIALLDVADKTNDVMYYTVVEGNTSLTDSKKQAIAGLVQSVAEAYKFQKTSDGKYVFFFEDFIRNLNKLYPNEYQGDIIKEQLKDYFTKTPEGLSSVKLLDNVNDPNMDENIHKTEAERIKERIGNSEVQRVDIDTIFEENNPKQIKEFWNLKLGDKLTYVVEDNPKRLYGKRIALQHNSTNVAYLPIPDINGFGNFEYNNEGWTITIHDRKTKAKANIEPFFENLLISQNPIEDRIRQDIADLNYNDSLTEQQKGIIIDRVYQYCLSKEDDNIIPDADPSEVVGFVCKIFKHAKPTINFANNNPQYIADDITAFFDNLYESYNAVNELAKEINSGSILDITVENINDGELIRKVEIEHDASKRTNDSHYYEFEQSHKAIANPNEVEVCVRKPINKDESIVIDTNGNRILHDEIANLGEPHIIIPNRSGKNQYCVATAVEIGDTQLDKDSEAYKIIQDTNKALNKQFDDNLSNGNVVEFLEFLYKLTGKKVGKKGVEHKDINKGTKPLLYGIDWNQNGDNIILTQYADNGRDEIIFNLKNNSVKLVQTRNDGENKVQTQKEFNKNNINELKDNIKSFVSKCKFNLDYSYFSPYSRNTNSFASKTSTGGFDVVVLDGTETEEEVKKKVHHFTSFKDFVVKGGVVRVNTTQEDGTNYRRKGKDQRANQIMKVSLKRISSPIEKNDDTQQTTTTQQPTTQIQQVDSSKLEELVKSGKDNSVEEIFKLALGDKLTDKILKSLNEHELLPKNLIFVEEILDNRKRPINAKANKRTKEVTVTRQWLNMLTGTGNVVMSDGSVENLTGRLTEETKTSFRNQALRKLIHEQLHIKLGRNREAILKQVKQIFDEFGDYLTKNPETYSKYGKYLFEKEKDENRRLEEFLVESMTSKELAEFLNTIESTFEVDESKVDKNNLWNKLLNILAELFNYVSYYTKGGKNIEHKKFKVKETSLLQKELYALQGALVINENTESNTETQTIENTSTESTSQNIDEFFGKTKSNDKYEITDNDIMLSTVVENQYAEEMQQIKDQAIADGTFMKAPNGKPTNLTERQWLQVRTKAFKEWFGDWENDPANASKVVDENGEPLVVYNYSDIESPVFDKNVVKDTYSHAFWFSSNPKIYKSYGSIKKDVFLNIKRIDKITTEEYDKDYTGKYIREGVQSRGFDGIEEVVKPKAAGGVTLNRIFHVYEPNQIKSATNNVGTFSKENNNIFFSTIMEDTPLITIKTDINDSKLKSIKKFNDNQSISDKHANNLQDVETVLNRLCDYHNVKTKDKLNINRLFSKRENVDGQFVASRATLVNRPDRSPYSGKFYHADEVKRLCGILFNEAKKAGYIDKNKTLEFKNIAKENEESLYIVELRNMTYDEALNESYEYEDETTKYFEMQRFDDTRLSSDDKLYDKFNNGRSVSVFVMLQNLLANNTPFKSLINTLGGSLKELLDARCYLVTRNEMKQLTPNFNFTSAAIYDPTTNAIYVNNSVKFGGKDGIVDNTILHEIIHMIVHNANPTDKQINRINNIFNKARTLLAKKYGKSVDELINDYHTGINNLAYGLSNVDEFISEIFTNSNLLKELNNVGEKIDGVQRSLFKDILDWIVSFLNVKSDVLEESIESIQDVLLNFDGKVNTNKKSLTSKSYKLNTENKTRHSSVSEFVSLLSPENQLKCISDIKDGTMEISCKL